MICLCLLDSVQPFAARTRRPTSITTLDGSDLEYVEIYKCLGVWLDCKLSVQPHIKHLQSKIKSRVGILFRNKASAACDWNELQKSLKLETFISLTNFTHLLSEQLTDRCSCT